MEIAVRRLLIVGMNGLERQTQIKVLLRELESRCLGWTLRATVAPAFRIAIERAGHHSDIELVHITNETKSSYAMLSEGCAQLGEALSMYPKVPLPGVNLESRAFNFLHTNFSQHGIKVTTGSLEKALVERWESSDRDLPHIG